jgi:hypothetical protein
VHERLADIADDPMERAGIALARRPDELAAVLMDAAAVAQQRGAPGAAADAAGGRPHPGLTRAGAAAGW